MAKVVRAWATCGDETSPDRRMHERTLREQYEVRAARVAIPSRHPHSHTLMRMLLARRYHCACMQCYPPHAACATILGEYKYWSKSAQGVACGQNISLARALATAGDAAPAQARAQDIHANLCTGCTRCCLKV